MSEQTSDIKKKSTFQRLQSYIYYIYYINPWIFKPAGWEWIELTIVEHHIELQKPRSQREIQQSKAKT